MKNTAKQKRAQTKGAHIPENIKRLYDPSEFEREALDVQRKLELYAQEQPEDEYRIKIGDTLAIRIEETCTHRRTWKVDERGKVRVPLIGEIQAEGKTERELEDEIAARMSEYIINPKVRVFIIEKHK